MPAYTFKTKRLSTSFRLVDTSKTKLLLSPSPFVITAWSELLHHYPDSRLRIHLVMLLRFGCLLGYHGSNAFILSKNPPSTLIDLDNIEKKITQDLYLGRIVEVEDPSPPFISSPLGLVPKHDGGFRKIQHLSYPARSSVNDYIAPNAFALSYSSLQKVFNMVVNAGKHSVLIKRDVKDAFRNIPVAPHMQWLLGFQWRDQYYQGTCLPFGLSTAPFIFNLFAEAFHWILESYLHWSLEHYLDDFIAILSATEATPVRLAEYETQYKQLTNVLEIPRQDNKDCTGTIVPVFGIQVDTIVFVASLPSDEIA